jgi:tetratricopeptide (TPR) repeat protein
MLLMLRWLNSFQQYLFTANREEPRTACSAGAGRGLLGILLVIVIASAAPVHAQVQPQTEASAQQGAPSPTEAPDPRQLFDEAQAAEQRGDKTLAIQEYKELIQFHPEVVAAHANLAVLLSSLGRYDEAITQYQIALTEAPGSPPLRLNLALAYYKKGDFAGAAAQLAALHAEKPSDVRVATLLGKCEVEMGLVGLALALLEPLEKDNADNLDLEWALGTALIRTGDSLEGLKRVQKVADQGQNADAYQLAANLYLGLTFFDIAKRDAEAVVRLNPKSPKAYVVLGMIADNAGDAKGAQEQYEKALQLDPNDLQARLQLANALYVQRKLDDAQREANRVLAQDANSSGARFELAEIEQAEGNLAQAVADLEKAVQLSPQWIQPHVQLSGLYYRLKRPEDGAREKTLVDQLRDKELTRRGQARVINPQVPPQFVSPEIPAQ